jgi:hypothetical protein
VMMPVRDHDHIGCFADQVKLTRALIRDLDEPIKEVKLLGEHRILSYMLHMLKSIIRP